MGGVARSELVLAVTKAGGFGFLGADEDSSETILSELATIRSELKLEKDDVLPVGVGFLGWVLDRTEAPDPEEQDPRLGKVLAEKPRAVWFAFGHEGEDGEGLGRYVKKVREYDARRFGEHKTLVFVIVNSVEDGVRATNEWGVDGLVVQGNEAGGHGSANAPPLSVLLSVMISALPHAQDSNISNKEGPIILAAGGIATGSQIASALTLGASGVALGTRFLFTHEAVFPSLQKDVILRAGRSGNLNSTRRSTAFDEVRRRGTLWPEGLDGRAIVNGILEDVEGGVELEERVRRYEEGRAEGESERQVVWAGTGVGLTREIRNAGVRSDLLWSEVMEELHTQTVQALRRASILLVPD
ncbi:hypothetical protein AAF712_004653 [Marasmius tenuissimus]|uniref:Nitronate monooxygenase domain-containing protein n=1 Tax=Marasmius tenuissimus TaxID=585030 RepID=A0ABR3A5K4_9AGAR